MTPHQIELVQSSFDRLRSLGEDGGRIFYGRLFNIAPEVRPLFHGNLEEQADKLLNMLGAIVADLHDLDRLLPAARDLAVRHAGYGVEPEHYAPVGEALLWTLADQLEPNFDEETADAWRIAYATLAEAMKAAAYSGEQVP